jgi:hypothetical protein
MKQKDKSNNERPDPNSIQWLPAAYARDMAAGPDFLKMQKRLEPSTSLRVRKAGRSAARERNWPGVGI